MIQVYTVEAIETAILLGTLIPPDAPPRYRHRFWVGEHRVDVFKSTDGQREYIHWYHRKSGRWEHPRPDGCRMIRRWASDGTMRCFYQNGDESSVFRPSKTPEATP